MFNPPGLIRELQCPICHLIVATGQFAGPQDIEPAAIAFIREQNHDWEPEQGCCPKCLQAVLTTLLEQPELYSRQLQTPVYGILPVGLRLGYSNAYRGKGITIAFLDSGFSNHPDLEGRIKLYVDASQSEIRELQTVETAGDLSWHGTMTSVVACGDGTLSGGLYRGLAHEAEVILIRVSDSDGRINDETIGRGLGWLLANAHRFNIQIVNISLGGGRSGGYANHPLDLMVEALIGQGVLVVCAAGNAGRRSLLPPASAPSAVTVGGLDDKNTLHPETYELWHSNYGQTHTGVWKPELVAPSLWLAAPVLPDSSVAREASVLGVLLEAAPEELPALLPAHSAALAQMQHISPEFLTMETAELRQALRQAWRAHKLITAYYQHVDGTSFAAPIVTSAAAQMLEINPYLTPAGLKDLLMRTARYLPEVSPDQQGHGVVDPWSAVAAALTTAQSSNREAA